ncbi:lysozyme [Lysobacter enzymogenes]|uniref:lysozyme n=1 Tax=Lysobacter enzymogenes TaxID=69 RepID=UPI001A96204B|nr:lysozyme [Lysobacter enzymogenes]QQP96535.1 lysozyme [Lysobacter enzymogenes]
MQPWEGRELKPYRDIVGVWTWCDGETQGLHKAQYTNAECDALTRNSAARTLSSLSTCIKRPIAQHEWVAVGSWAYNVGTQAACRSTLVRQINEGAPGSVWCRQLLKWDYAGGKRIWGLTRRREAEYQMCIGAVE